MKALPVAGATIPRSRRSQDHHAQIVAVRCHADRGRRPAHSSILIALSQVSVYVLHHWFGSKRGYFTLLGQIL